MSMAFSGQKKVDVAININRLLDVSGRDRTILAAENLEK
jgi:hypothetical protein